MQAFVSRMRLREFVGTRPAAAIHHSRAVPDALFSVTVKMANEESKGGLPVNTP
jgi:hypothetical protein